MKTIALGLLALSPAVAQIRPQPAAPVEAAKVASTIPGGNIPTSKPRITRESIQVLQSGFDSDLASYNYNDSIDVIGRTRGIYLNDYGVIFTTELSPIVTPGITPFVQKIPDDMKARVHQRKLDRVPAIKKLMGQMMKRTAEQLSLLPDDQQIVLAVKLLYLPYEDTQGLPLQIVMKADKRSAMTGKFTTEQE